MPLVINTNVTSLTAQRFLGNNSEALSRSMERLASGYRINRAGDDAAGLQMSENLRAQIRGSQKAYDNVQDGFNVLNIADGTYQTIEDNLQRIRELTVQAANDTYATAQRSAIAVEIVQLLTDIDRMANAVAFNGVKLLDGSAATFNLQVGPNNTANDRVNIAGALADMRANTAGGLNVTGWNGTVLTPGPTTNANAGTFLGVIDASINKLNVARGTLGAMMNRLQGASNNLSISIENLQSSESKIRNVDVAAESARMTQNQILQQSATAVLSQANQIPSAALTLLQGR